MLIVLGQGSMVRVFQSEFQAYENGGVSLYLGIYDQESLSKIHPSPKLVWNLRGELINESLPPFDSSWGMVLMHVQKKILDIDLKSSPACLGGVNISSEASKNDLLISGWVVKNHFGLPDLVLFVNDEDEITGFAKIAMYQDWLAIISLKKENVKVHWFGYSVGLNRDFKVYAFYKKYNTFCKIKNK
jgi:hypothetical protein